MTWTDHKTQRTWQEILMSPKIEPVPFVCSTVYVCVWRRYIMVLQIILYFLISSNTVGGGWDGSNCKGKMNAGEWINGGKALFNHCSADGTFIFSSMTHTQHINNNKTSVSFGWILTLPLDIHLLRKTQLSHPWIKTASSKFSTVPEKLLVVCEWNAVRVNGSPISRILTETWINHVVWSPIGVLQVHL